jgi:hypothetical protein
VAFGSRPIGSSAARPRSPMKLLTVTDRAKWRAWLEKHHDQKGIDEKRLAQRFTPAGELVICPG